MRVAALVLLIALGAAATAEARPVAHPRFVRNIATGETGWFASPGLADVTGDSKLEIVAPFYSTFVYGAKGRLLGKGTATDGRVYAPGVVADLDGDGVKEIVVGGNEGTVAAYNLDRGRPAGQAGLAGVDVQRRPVPRDARDGRGRPRRRRPRRGGGDDDQHVADRVAGLRLRAERDPGGRMAPVQHVVGPDVQRRRQPRLRRLRGERRDRQSGPRPAARGRRHVRQPPDQPLQPRRHVGARVAVVPQPRELPQRRAARLGAVHPLAEPQGGGRPLPPPRRRLAGRAQDRVAAVDRLAALDRRPGPRRAQRGDRAAEHRAQGALRDAGLRVHGARRRLRQPLGPPAQGVPQAAADEQARRARRRRLVPAERHPRAHDRQPPREPAAGDRRVGPRRVRLRRRARAARGCGATTTPAAGRRRSRPRSSPPTSTATAGPSSSSAPTGRSRTPAGS